MDRLFAFLIPLFMFAPPSPANVSTTRPVPGIIFDQDVRNDPPLHLFIVTVDLTDPRIHLKVSRGGNGDHLPPPWEATLMPVSQMAQRDGLFVAINGNMYQARDILTVLGRNMPYVFGNRARACGWAMSDGKLFSGSPIDRDWPSLVVDDRGKVTIGHFDRVPENARQIISGIWQIVTDGRITAGADPGDSNQPAPHSAVGIDRDGKTLMMFVVDGRRSNYSVGMGWHEIAVEMLARGAWNALMLDGGGSTTMVIRNKDGKPEVVNQPSDGHDLPIPLSVERCVINALGVLTDGADTRANRR